jgi:hypothetical protein
MFLEREAHAGQATCSPPPTPLPYSAPTTIFLFYIFITHDFGEALIKRHNLVWAMASYKENINLLY